MKKIKLFTTAFIFIFTATLGYLGYASNVQISDTDQIIQANLEALSSDEGGGEGDSVYCHSGGVGAVACSISAGTNV